MPTYLRFGVFTRCAQKALEGIYEGNKTNRHSIVYSGRIRPPEISPIAREQPILGGQISRGNSTLENAREDATRDPVLELPYLPPGQSDDRAGRQDRAGRKWFSSLDHRGL
eukprot:1173086-Prorocentrum_minimum.AAC.2